MPYAPINTMAFTSAYAGAVSGMAISGWITNPTPASYLLVTQIAGAFAQAFDQAWNNPSGLNVLEQLGIVAVCQNEFQARGPGPLANPLFQLASSWAIPAAACAALMLEGDAYFLSQGITPPPFGSGVTSVTGTAPIVSTGGATPAISISPATPATPGSLSAADKTKLDTVTAGAAVSTVTGTFPIGSSGGTTPNITIAPATPATAGSLSAADKTKLDGIAPGAAVSAVTGTAPIASSGGATPNITISAATPVAAGSMSAADKAKLDGIAPGAAVASVSGAAPITSTGGANPTIGITAATELAAGSMSAADKTKLDGLGAGGGFTTVLDFDFTAQPTQVLSPDGNYVIGGLTWTKVHSAADAVAMQVTNGTGLVIKPTGGSNYDQGLNNISAPWLWLPFSALTLPAGWNWQNRYRMFLSLGAGTNLTTTFDGCFFGLGDVNSTIIANTQNVGASGTGLSAFFSGRVGSQRESDGMTAATQLTAMHQSVMTPLLQSTIAYSGTLAAGAAFPNPNAFVNPATFTVDATDGFQATIAMANLGLFVGAKRAGSPTNLTVVVQRLRLDLEG